MSIEKPVKVEDLPWQDWNDGARFQGRIRRLANTRDGSGLRVGVVMEELQPGKQSCPFHFHLHEEEHILMLEGEVTLRLGDERHVFRAGEFVSFPSGAPRGHCLLNESGAPARYLTIGENNPGDVCIYPDSSKIAFPGEPQTRKLGPQADYYDGENPNDPL